MPTSRSEGFSRDCCNWRVIAPILVFSMVSLGTLLSYQTSPQSNSWEIVAPAQAKQSQETQMIETIQQLSRVLSTAPLSAKEAATSLGTILEDQGEDLPLLVQPFDSSFREAWVVRQVGTDEPAHVKLILTEPGTLSVAALSGAFGNYSEPPRRDGNRPRRIIFNIDLTNLPRTCAVIADVKPGKEGVKDGTAIAVIIRRDIRLE